MKKAIQSIAIVAALMWVIPLAAQTQAKIGTVDLKRVFDGYYKTQQADKNLKERASDLDKVQKGLLEEYQTANEDFKGLQEKVNDAAISQEEKQRRQEALEAKREQIAELEAQIKKFRSEAQAQLGDQQRRLREDILRQIQELIASQARTQGYTIVLDTAVEGVSNTPVVLYSNGQNDMTDALLRELNASAPASFKNASGTSTGTRSN